MVAHDSDADGNVNDGAINIGYFVDNVFPFCNSYACCDPQTKGKSVCNVITFYCLISPYLKFKYLFNLERGSEMPDR